MHRHVMCLLVTVLLVVPATASAAVATSVDSLSTGHRFLYDASNPPTVDLAGTADTSLTSVDLKCVSGNAGSIGIGTTPIANDVPVDSGTGAWSTSAQWPGNATGMCEVFAVPHGTTPATNNDLNGEAGYMAYSAYFDVSKAGNDQAYDYYATMAAPHGFYELDSLGDAPLFFGELINMHEYDASIFDRSAWLEDADPTDAFQPSMVVDGKPAYSTYFIGEQPSRADLPGWTGLTFQIADDGGAWHLTSHEGIFQCASSDAFPPDACTGWQSSGIALDVDERQSTDGRTLVQQLRFTNEGAQSHTLSLVLHHESVDSRQWNFPGTGGFQDYGAGAAPSAIAPAVATIRNQIDPPNPESITKGVGAITYAATPTAEKFVDPDTFFVQRYTNLTIPPNGAVRLEFIYNMSDKVVNTVDPAAGLDGLVSSAESSFGAPPGITVSSPADATAAAYTLTGTVNAPEGLNGLTVNGQAASVAGNGSFSVPETLAAGANAFSLVATDELGRTTTTPFSVTLSTSGPPPNGNVAAVRFGKSGKAKLKGRVLTTGYTASCPGTGPACSITAAATAGRKKAGSGKATVNAGAKAKIKVKLTKAAARQLTRKHKLKLSLKLTGKRTGAATTTTKRALTLKKTR